MRHLFVSGLAALVLVGSAHAAGHKSSSHGHGSPSAKSSASRDGWPDTKAAARASGWVEAFSSGETAMRAYLEKNMTETALAERSIAKRMESYRKLREQLGALVLGSVDDSTPYTITASLLGEDASVHRFVFTVQEQAPHKLVSVGRHERRHGHESGGHGH